MLFLIGLLKFVIIVLLNIGLGYLLCALIYNFFFCPKPLYFFSKKIPFTPGFLFRKKKFLIKKLNELIDNYLDYAINENNRHNYLAEFEDKIFKSIHQGLKSFFQEKLVPKFIKNKLMDWSENIAKMLIKKLTRELIPYIIYTLNIKDKIDLLNQKLDIHLLKSYFDQYVYKYIKYFTYAFFGLIGIFNAVIYLILSFF